MRHVTFADDFLWQGTLPHPNRTISCIIIGLLDISDNSMMKTFTSVSSQMPCFRRPTESLNFSYFLRSAFVYFRWSWSWFWSCYFGLGLKNLVLFTSLANTYRILFSRVVTMHQKYIDCIEKVQRQFTKRLPGLKSMSYTDRLKCLGLTSIEVFILYLWLSFPLQLVLCTCTFDTCTNKDQSINQSINIYSDYWHV